MNNEKQTIDCTPTWQALLPVMLDLQITLGSNKKQTNEQYVSLMNLRKEFKAMAGAADNWNEHCKEVNSRRILVGGEETTIGEFVAANTAKDVTPISDEDIQAVYNLPVCKYEGASGTHIIYGGGAGATVITRIS